MTQFPKLVANLVMQHNAWIVGSAADPEQDLSKVRDWDVIVPFSNWLTASGLIPQDAKPNRFGGWRCQSEGQEVDVWPDDIAMILNASKSKFAWHPRSGARWVRI